MGESYGSVIAFYISRLKAAEIDIESIIFIPGIYRIKSFEKKINRIYLTVFGTLFPHRQHPENKVPLARFTNVERYRHILSADPYFDRKASLSYLLGLHKLLKFMQENIHELTIPLFIFHGGHDNYASSQTVLDFFEQRPQVQKEIVFLENSEHWLLGSGELRIIQTKLEAWLKA